MDAVNSFKTTLTNAQIFENNLHYDEKIFEYKKPVLNSITDSDLKLDTNGNNPNNKFIRLFFEISSDDEKNIYDMQNFFQITKNRLDKKLGNKEIDHSYLLKLKKEFETLIKEEEVVAGYVSRSQSWLEEKLLNSPSIKQVILELARSFFEEPHNLAKLIEVVSSIDYNLLSPYNHSLIQLSISHKDIEIQEACIASYEKWDDKENVKYLKSTSFSNSFIKNYADEVIRYLEEIE